MGHSAKGCPPAIARLGHADRSEAHGTNGLSDLLCRYVTIGEVVLVATAS
jgi:hypothetical protein